MRAADLYDTIKDQLGVCVEEEATAVPTLEMSRPVRGSSWANVLNPWTPFKGFTHVGTPGTPYEEQGAVKPHAPTANPWGTLSFDVLTEETWKDLKPA